jgi:ABC-type uncharacterized transport system substrate-binding protein
VPSAVQVAVLSDPTEPSAETTLEDVNSAGHTMGLHIRVLNASTSGEIDAAFETIGRERPDVIFVGLSPFFTSRRLQLTHWATRVALPAIFSDSQYAEAGGLMSYGANLADAWRQVGFYTGRILRGAKPADLPVVQSSKFELVINHQTARMLGLVISPSLLAVADEVIE